jgi:hypothetical protein
MHRTFRVILATVTACLCNGCYSISLRNDILQGLPINEAVGVRRAFTVSSSDAGITSRERLADVSLESLDDGPHFMEAQLEGGALMYRGSRTNNLRKLAGGQVYEFALSNGSKLNVSETSITEAEFNDPQYAWVSGFYAVDLRTHDLGIVHLYRNSGGYDMLVDTAPVPEPVKASGVIRAIHASAKSAANAKKTYIAGANGKAVAENTSDNSGKAKDVSITLDDGFKFVQAILRVMNANVLSPETIRKVALQRSFHIISFEGLVFCYYEEYFNKGFIDRSGTKYAKPKLTNSIGDDVIDAFTLIFVEAIFDYELCERSVNDPVLYSGDLAKTPAFDTPTGDEPTAAVLIPNVLVLETPQNNDQAKLAIIRFVSGRASEGAKKLSGILGRTFSHAHVSFVLGGSLSFGGNDTLMKFFDTLAERLAQRFTEIALWQALDIQKAHAEHARTASERKFLSDRQADSGTSTFDLLNAAYGPKK